MSFIEERNSCFFAGIYGLFFYNNDGQKHI